jgi:aspartate/methionine/tyrosine aminotransferase
LRICWLTTSKSDLIERWLTYKDYTTICNSAPSEILAIIALQNTERIVARNLAIIRENIALAKQFFDKHRDRVAWISPKAGSIAFPQWLGNIPVEQFCQEVLEQQGLMIVMGSLFDFPGNHFRVGLGRKNFGEALEHLDEYLGG